MEGLFKNDTLESMCKDKPSLAERERERERERDGGRAIIW
jgi:hypothetical protein